MGYSGRKAKVLEFVITITHYWSSLYCVVIFLFSSYMGREGVVCVCVCVLLFCLMENKDSGSWMDVDM